MSNDTHSVALLLVCIRFPVKVNHSSVIIAFTKERKKNHKVPIALE